MNWRCPLTKTFPRRRCSSSSSPNSTSTSKTSTLLPNIPRCPCLITKQYFNKVSKLATKIIYRRLKTKWRRITSWWKKIRNRGGRQTSRVRTKLGLTSQCAGSNSSSPSRWRGNRCSSRSWSSCNQPHLKWPASWSTWPTPRRKIWLCTTCRFFWIRI